VLMPTSLSRAYGVSCRARAERVRYGCADSPTELRSNLVPPFASHDDAIRQVD